MVFLSYLVNNDYLLNIWKLKELVELKELKTKDFSMKSFQASLYTLLYRLSSSSAVRLQENSLERSRPMFFFSS